MATSSSKPQKVNFLVKQGDTFRRVFSFFQADQTTPVDISGATFRFIIDGHDDLTLGDGLTIQGTDNNQILLSVDIDWTGSAKFELERVMNGVTWTPFEGSLKSEAELLEE